MEYTEKYSKEDITMKNIAIFLSENPYPLNTGGKVSIYERIKALSAFYKITVFFCEWDNSVSAKQGEKLLEPFVARTVVLFSLEKSKLKVKLLYWMYAIFGLKPKFHFLFSHKINASLIQESLIEMKPELVLIENIYAGVFSKYILNTKYVYFAHNVEFLVAKTAAINVFRKIYCFLDSFKLFRFERGLIHKAAKVITFTEKDKAIIQKNFVDNKNDKVVSIPPIMEASCGVSSGKCFLDRDNRILMPTNAKWGPNIVSLKWFFSEVFPLLTSKPQIILTGNDENDFLKGISTRYENVFYYGSLSRQEYVKLLSSAGLFINPTIAGSGFQIKLIEAASYHIPIITTSFSNYLSEDIMSSDDPKELADMIELWCLEKGDMNMKFNYIDFYRVVEAKLLDALERI